MTQVHDPHSICSLVGLCYICIPMNAPKMIYMDYNSTTPLDSRCLDSMIPFLTTHFGNSSNELHAMGWTAKNAIQKSSEQVAELIGAKPYEIIWNSGATEGNNTVLRYLAAHSITAAIPHFITSSIEHPSVLKTCHSLAEQGLIELSILPVDRFGFVSSSELQNLIQENTVLCSIMWINNEIGTVQNLTEIADICATKSIHLHTDATQAIGKIEIDLRKIRIHYLTASAHKFYGPKGVGFLYVRSQNPSVESPKIFSGGSHQRGVRPGTLNTAGIVGTGVACEILKHEQVIEIQKNRQLCLYFYDQLKIIFPHLVLNGPEISSDTRSPMNMNFTFKDALLDLKISKLMQIAFSQGSACQSGETSMSSTLKAIGLTESQARSTLRLSVGRLSQKNELDFALKIIKTALG